jgi:hypothetical protein
MGVLWYYGRGSDITGPVSGSELADLAAAGRVLPTDTVWQDGVENGVPAGRVRNLFPSSPSAPQLDAVAGLSMPAGEPAAGGCPAPAEPAGSPVPEAPALRAAPPQSGRAVAGKGVVLVAQDGKTVKYRGKCATCGREEAGWKSIAIPRGTTRVGFFCPKCRRRTEGEVHGYR